MPIVRDEVLRAADNSNAQDEILVKGPADTTHQPETEETRLRRTVRAAVIASEVAEEPFIASFFQLNDRSKPEVRQRSGEDLLLAQADAQRKEQLDAVLGFFIEQAQGGAEIGPIKDAIEQVKAEDAANSVSVGRGTTQYVDSMASSAISPETRRDLETRLELLDRIGVIADDITGLEIAKDLALEIAFAPKMLLDNGQLTGSFTNLFENQETVRRTLGWFQGLSPADKERFFPQMEALALEALPRSRAVLFLTALLDPSSEEQVLDEFGFWPLLDAAAIAAGVAGLALRLRKVLNPIKAAAAAGDYRRAADMNVALLNAKDDTLGELLDVPRLTAVDNAAPFKADEFNDAADATISPAVHERIFQFRDKVREVFGALAEGRTFARESFVDELDRPAALRRIDEEYKTYVAETFQDKDKIVNLVNRKETSRGLEFEFEVTNPDGTIIKDTYSGMFVRDDVGIWQSLPTGSVFLSELAQAAKTDFIGLVQAVLRIDLTQANVGSQLRSLAKEAAKPIRKIKGGILNRKQRIDQVDKVLLSGDDMLKEYTPEQLKDGVNGIKLDDDQIEYYYNMRGVMNGIGILRNMDTRANMLQRGVKEIKINQSKTFGEALEIDQAKRRLAGSQGEIRTVYKVDGSNSEAINVRNLDIEEEYGKGFQLIRLEEDTILGSGRFKHVLVKGDDIGPLPGLVVDLKPGYVPRINPNALYFVQAFTRSTLDGVGDFTRKAVRSFDNKREAQEFAAEFDLAKVSEGFQSDTQIRVVTDGELEAFKAGDSGLGGAHGLIHSPRARQKIPHNDGDASTVPRTSALEAIELYLENTKNFLTRSEWRMGAQTKWENTARWMLPGNRDISFENPGAALANAELRNAHEKIRVFSGFMDKSERRWEGTVRAAHEFAVDNLGRGRISDIILSQRQTDPLAYLRSLTFHTLLGMFNPIQLWVQAQGAAVALAMNITNPVRLQKVFRQMHSMALIQRAVAGKLTKQQLEGIAKAGGFKNAAEMTATKELWDKSGLFQSVLSSADVEAAARGFPMTGGALKAFAGKGLLFFRTGELFNRRMGFLTAMDEAGGAAKVAASDSLFKKVMDRSNNLILNLGKGNKANWQKGFLSIPTQFLQIQAKTLESLLGLNGAFTKVERAKLLMTQLALYGTAGVFGGNWVARNVLSATGTDQLDIDKADPARIRALTGGFTDWIAYQLGADIIASDRGALLNGMDQTALSLFTEEMTAFEMFAGPSSVLPTRMAAYMAQLQPWFAIPQDINGETEVTAQEVTDVLRRIATDVPGLIVSPFATASQYNKFQLMQDLGILKDKNGNLIAAPVGGFNWQTEWAALIGFKPELLQRKFDLSDINQEYRDYIRFRTTMLINKHDDFLMALERARVDGKDLTDEQLRRFRVDRQVQVDSMNPQLRFEVLKSFRQRLVGRREGGSQLDRQQQRYWDNMVFELTDAWFDDPRGKGITSDDTRVIQIQPREPQQEDE